MSRNPYPTSYDDYKDDSDIADVNVHGEQGGPQNLPDTESYSHLDDYTGKAKTWDGNWQQYR